MNNRVDQERRWNMATARRARSAERPGESTDDGLGRLTNALEQLLVQQQERLPGGQRKEFKAPEYNGQTDVETFITQFTDVAEVNEWSAKAALLHLRERLKEQARDCGRGSTLPAIFTMLRARFGITPKQARTRLANLKKEYKTTLQEHAMEVERLSNLAFGDLPEPTRQEMAVEHFSGSLGNAYLQRHLLAIHTPTLEAAVRAGNEFLQVKSNVAGTAIHAVQPELPDGAERELVTTTQTLLPMLMKNMQDLISEVSKLKAQVGARRTPKNKDPKEETPRCWECDQVGHMKRNCPGKAQPSENKERLGNDSTPQQ